LRSPNHETSRPAACSSVGMAQDVAFVGSPLVQSVEEAAWIDRAADPVQRAASSILEKAPGLHSALHGRWLGHPLHAALTDVPLGAWTAGLALDLAEVFGGRRDFRRGTDAVLTVGLVGAGAAALAGITDWTDTCGRAKRLGFVHGVLNTAI